MRLFNESQKDISLLPSREKVARMRRMRGPSRQFNKSRQTYPSPLSSADYFARKAQNIPLGLPPSPSRGAVVCTYLFAIQFLLKLNVNPKLSHYSSSRRKSGPRLSACVPVESLGPGVRRDDGIRNEFSMMTDAYMTTEICESVSSRGEGRIETSVA